MSRETIEKTLDELYRDVDTKGSPEPDIKLIVLVPKRVARRILEQFRASVLEEAASIVCEYCEDNRKLVRTMQLNWLSGGDFPYWSHPEPWPSKERAHCTAGNLHEAIRALAQKAKEGE